MRVKNLRGGDKIECHSLKESMGMTSKLDMARILYICIEEFLPKYKATLTIKYPNPHSFKTITYQASQFLGGDIKEAELNTHIRVKGCNMGKALTNKDVKDRILKREDFKRIHEAAYGEWKDKLVNLFGKQYALSDEATVTGSEYQEMRDACNDSQNELLDGIFGKVSPKFKEGDYLYFTPKQPYTANYAIEIGDIAKVNRYRADYVTVEWISEVNSQHNGDYRLESFRLATKEEIKAATWYKKNTLCLVRDDEYEGWSLRYSSERVGMFYVSGKNSGSSTCDWIQHRKLDINNLPDPNK